jgi:molecular chaperone GrpE
MSDETTEPMVGGTDPSADDGDAVVDVAEPMSELDKLAAERDEYLELARRLQAEFENYRKRVSAQTADDIDRATGRIAEALLPVLDAC